MNILQQIVDHKRSEVAALKKQYGASDFRSMAYFHKQTISLLESLRNHTPFAVIAEIKRSSPSAGMMRQQLPLAETARAYEQNGAAGISILTDKRYFSGTIGDLSDIRNAVSLPLLRKDFIVDPIQLFEAKAFGADAVLLIASVLETNELSDLHILALELGLECLVELYEARELEKIDTGTMPLIGINNRDLRTISINLNHSIELSAMIPAHCTLVSESGIHSPGDITLLYNAGIRAALIGEYFMKSPQPGMALRQLLESIA